MKTQPEGPPVVGAAPSTPTPQPNPLADAIEGALGNILGGKKSIGDILILAGTAIKAVHAAMPPEPAAPQQDGPDQSGMPIQIVAYEDVLSLGVCRWSMLINGRSLKFDVDVKSGKGRIFLHLRGERTMLKLGGNGEKTISDVLRQWLGQFYTIPEQAAMLESESDTPTSPHHMCVMASLHLIDVIEKRQPKKKR